MPILVLIHANSQSEEDVIAPSDLYFIRSNLALVTVLQLTRCSEASVRGYPSTENMLVLLLLLKMILGIR